MMDTTEYGMLRTELEKYSDNKFDAITTDMDYKGSVASASNLPASGTLGDVYTTADTGARYIWDGTQWTQIESVASQLQEIIDAGNTQVGLIEDKGEETLESIPDDYTELSNTVSKITDSGSLELSGNISAYINVSGQVIYIHETRKVAYWKCEKSTEYTVTKTVSSDKYVIGQTATEPSAVQNTYLTSAPITPTGESATFTTDANAEYIAVYYYNGDVTSAETILASISVTYLTGAKDNYARRKIEELVPEYNFKTTGLFKTNVFLQPNVTSGIYDGSNYSYDDFDDYSTTAEYYAKMNALADSWYFMQKENLGKDASNTYDIYGYSLKMFALHETSLKRPAIIITSCHHGFEKGSAFALYYFFKALKEKSASNEMLANILYNYDFYFIPIVNPWGWENYNHVLTDVDTIGRDNSNGVDLNRYNDPNNLQPEQIIVKNFVDDHKTEAIMFIDFHTNGSTRYTAYSASTKNFISVSSLVKDYTTLKSIASSFIDYFSYAIGSSFWGDVRLCGGISVNTSNITSSVFFHNYGIAGLTFEGTHKMGLSQAELETEAEFLPLTNKYNTVLFANFVYHAMNYWKTVYNS